MRLTLGFGPSQVAEHLSYFQVCTCPSLLQRAQPWSSEFHQLFLEKHPSPQILCKSGGCFHVHFPERARWEAVALSGPVLSEGSGSLSGFTCGRDVVREGDLTSFFMGVTLYLKYDLKCRHRPQHHDTLYDKQYKLCWCPYSLYEEDTRTCPQVRLLR